MTSVTLVQAMAILNSLSVGLVAQYGWRNLPAARRYFDACPHSA